MKGKKMIYRHYILIVVLGVVFFGCDNSSDTDEMTAGEMAAGEMTAGEMTAGEMTAGEMTAGEMAAGEMAAGEMAAGEMAASTLAIVGRYMDDYMTEHVITEEQWTQTYEGDAPSVFHIERVNADEMYLIAQNDEMNAFSPSLWSRIDWTFSGEELFICQGVFDAESADAAESAEAPNSEDPSVSGCGMFPWSKLNAQ